ncbi:MAG: lasso peptide [Candidatus Acidiferrales bacterium]
MVLGSQGQRSVRQEDKAQLETTIKVDVSKKRYKTPILIVHGTVRDLTQRTGHRGTRDGGRRFRIRTHLR